MGAPQAMAWCLTNPNVSTCLMGASSLAQAKDNIGACKVARQLEVRLGYTRLLGNQHAEHSPWFLFVAAGQELRRAAGNRGAASKHTRLAARRDGAKLPSASGACRSVQASAFAVVTSECAGRLPAKSVTAAQQVWLARVCICGDLSNNRISSVSFKADRVESLRELRIVLVQIDALTDRLALEKASCW